MKKLLLSLFATILIFAAVFSVNDVLPEANAAEIIESGTCGYAATWTLDDEGTLTVSGSGYIDSDISHCLQYRKDEVKKVIIGSEITEISYETFFQFYALEEVEFEANSKLENISYGAFHGAPLKKITIPASVKEIGAYAFRAATTLTEVIFEENSQLEIIGEEAFCQTGIIEIVIPASVKEIKEAAFWRCLNLVKIEFEANSKLTVLGGLTEEGEQHPYFCGIFAECDALEEISLPENLEVLGNCVFSRCDSLVSVNLENCTGLTTIGENTFSACEKLEKVILPESVEIIKKGTFADSPVLNSVEFGDNSRLSFIGEDAFEYCIKLKEFDIPENVEYIGDDAFSWSAIKELHIPAAVTYFGSIYGPYVEKITVAPDNMYYSSDEYGALYNKDKTVLLTYPNGSTEKEFIIPDGVEVIAPYAFSFGINLEKVVMPDTVTEIQGCAFSYNFSVKEIVMSKNLDTLGEAAFAVCMKLEHLDVPAGVDKIEDYTFAYMYSLVDIKIYNRDVDVSKSELGILEFFGDESEKADFIEVLCDAQYYSLSQNEDYVIDKYGSLDKLMERYEYYFKEDGVVVTDHYTVYCYKDSAAEPYLKENNIKYAYLCDHVEEEIPAVAPTCTETGLTAGVKCSLCGDVLVEQETVGKTRHHSEEPVKENEIKATCKIAAYHEDVYYCVDCGAETIRIFVNGKTLPHAEEEIPAVAPTCTEAGLTAGVKCSGCGEVLVAQQPVGEKGHTPVVVGAIEPDTDVPGYTGDTICSECNELLVSGEEIPALEGEETIECDHICHKSGFMGFIWKMINFFQKLFKVEPVCECGAAHY